MNEAFSEARKATVEANSSTDSHSSPWGYP